MLLGPHEEMWDQVCDASDPGASAPAAKSSAAATGRHHPHQLRAGAGCELAAQGKHVQGCMAAAHTAPERHHQEETTQELQVSAVWGAHVQA
jgi:hypothetical protein